MSRMPCDGPLLVIWALRKILPAVRKKSSRHRFPARNYATFSIVLENSGL